MLQNKVELIYIVVDLVVLPFLCGITRVYRVRWRERPYETLATLKSVEKVLIPFR